MSSETPLAITTTATGFAVTGEIDAHTASAIGQALDGSNGDGVVELDLSGVEFVDSSGLRALIEAHQRFEASGSSLRLVHPSPAVVRLFEISGVDDYFNVSGE
jgi:anti-sigma B factor antagonist